MGKAAKRAKAKRKKYFIGLAAENPEKFISEYSKRLSSWSMEIEKSGGQQREEILAEALNILNACGKDIFAKYTAFTREILFEQFNPSFFLSIHNAFLCSPSCHHVKCFVHIAVCHQYFQNNLPYPH